VVAVWCRAAPVRACGGPGEEEGRRLSGAVPRPFVRASGGGPGAGGGAAAVWCRTAPVRACGAAACGSFCRVPSECERRRMLRVSGTGRLQAG
jgi:hypothetical protein